MANSTTAFTSSGQPSIPVRSQIAVQENNEMWVGYERRGRRFIDKIQAPEPADARLVALRYWWEGLVPTWKHMMYRGILCKRPCVFIASRPPASRAKIESQYFPHETQFTSVEKCEVLTRGFRNASSFADDIGYFARNKSFNVARDSEDTNPVCREALFVDWEVDKRYLALPFFGALTIAACIAVSVGISTQNIATGAQLGGSLCGVIAAVFCYVVWRCN